MAITDTKQAKDFTAGAPKITLEGDLRPNQMMAGSSRYQIILDELINEMEEALGRPITNDEYDKLGKEAYEKLYESSISTEQNQMMAMSDDANERALEQIFEQLLEEGFSIEDADKRAREIFNERAMADGGRAQYGLGSFVKSIGKAVKGVAKGVKKVAKSPVGKAAMLYFAPMALGQPAGIAGYQNLFSRVGPGITSLKDRFFPQFVDPGSEAFRKKSMLSSFLSPKSDAGKFARNFVIGSLATGALATAEAGGLDTSDPNAEIDVEALKSYLRTGYKNLNPGAQPEEVEEFVTANVAEYNSGGRVGLQFGGGFDASQADFGKEDLGPGFNGGDSTPFFNRPENFAPVGGQLRGAFETGIANLATNKIAKELGLGAAVKSVPQIMAVMGLLQALKGRDTFAMGSDKKVEMASGIEGLPININSKGVKELDLRETGGFIPPVGVKEKADDIPAMLSNNEFVFTADAVRAAGGGDVNKGAEIMYDTMKNLESRVA